MAGKGATEWEDALIKHGIIEAPEEIATQDDIALAMQEAVAGLDPLAHKSLQQLDEVEDDFPEEELDFYRFAPSDYVELVPLSFSFRRRLLIRLIGGNAWPSWKNVQHKTDLAPL